MNIFNKFFLYLAFIPSKLYESMGVDTRQLRAILNTKLVMDDRRVSGLQQARKRKNNKQTNYATIGTMLITAIMGCVYLFAFAVGHDYLTRLTIYFSVYIFTLTSLLISDFTSVLIDVRDNMIILPKPVNDKTFVLARLLHIVIHISKLVLPMALPGMIYIGIRVGPGSSLTLGLMILSATLFTIFLINAIYIFILKVTTPDKFKNIISYFQIAFAVLFYAGYQVVPRIANKAAMEGYSITHFNKAWLLVSYWFAAAWQFLSDSGRYASLWIYLVLIIVLPFVSIWLVVTYFAPSFNRKLAMISGSEGPAAPAGKTKKVKRTTSAYILTLSRWLTQKGTERVGFMQAWKITGRSRDFKMKVYPTIGYILVYIVLIFLQKGNSFANAARQHDTAAISFLFMSLVYFTSFVLMMAISNISYSEKYKAAWIYYTSPIHTPGNLLSGALKAMIVKFYLPIVMVVFITAPIVVGASIIPNLLLAMFNQLLIISLTSYIIMRELPFSAAPSTGSKGGGGFLRGLISMVIPTIVAIIHFVVFKFVIVVCIVAVLAAIAAWFMMDAVRNKSWEKVRLKEYEG